MSTPIEIVAHRGSSYLAPENTLAAICLGWDEGADAAEADFRLTRDGQIVAFHDETTQRTAGVGGSVAERTLDEMRALDVGSWKGYTWGGERVPTLAECLATIPPGKRFYVELKSGVEIIRPLVEVLGGVDDAAGKVLIVSLSWDVVTAAKQALPDVPVYHVTEFRWDKAAEQWIPSTAEILQRAKQARVDGLDLMAGGPLDAAMTAAFRQAGLRLSAWTVDDPELARHLIALGIHGITTNRPGWLREQVASHGS